MKKMKVKFRGVRGSHPTPKADFLAYGGNTSCVEVNIGDRTIILDAGTGIIDLGGELRRNYILSSDTDGKKEPIKLTLLLSHIHQDHIQGFPFFNPIYIPQTQIGVWGLPVGKKSLRDNLQSILYNKAFPLGLEDITCSITIEDFRESNYLIIDKNSVQKVLTVEEFKNYQKDKEDIIVTTHKTFAHPRNGCLCFKIEYQNKSLIYATDKESYVGSDKKFIEFASGADLLIHDSQYTDQEYTSSISPRQGFGHSTFKMAIETAKLAKVKQLALFHYDPNYDDNFLKSIEDDILKNNENVFFSREGLEVTL